MSSLSTSTTSTPAENHNFNKSRPSSQKPVVVVATKTLPSTGARKRSGSVVNSKKPKIQQLLIDGHPELAHENIMWINPEPGYGTPKNLTDMDDNTGKIFPRWLSYEKNTKVGYTLFDESDAKWWADAASIHILSRAQGYNITHTYFSFVVRRTNRIFTYGFIAKSYAQEIHIKNFAKFGEDMNVEMPVITTALEEDKKKSLKPIPIKKPENDEEDDDDDFEKIECDETDIVYGTAN